MTLLEQIALKAKKTELLRQLADIEAQEVQEQTKGQESDTNVNASITVIATDDAIVSNEKPISPILASLLAQKLSDKKILDTNIQEIVRIEPIEPPIALVAINQSVQPTLLDLLRAKSSNTNTLKLFNFCRDNSL